MLKIVEVQRRIECQFNTTYFIASHTLKPGVENALAFPGNFAKLYIERPRSKVSFSVLLYLYWSGTSYLFYPSMAFYWPSVSEAEGLPHLMLKYEPHAPSSAGCTWRPAPFITNTQCNIDNCRGKFYVGVSTPFSTMYL